MTPIHLSSGDQRGSLIVASLERSSRTTACVSADRTTFRGADRRGIDQLREGWTEEMLMMVGNRLRKS
jgi:hypothetical protein